MTFDFLVLGSGLAGLYSAHNASEFGSVALVTKTSLITSNSYNAQGGIAAVVDPTDSLESHVNDTIVAGRGLCNLEAVNVLVENGSRHIKELISMSAFFDLDDGKIALGLEGGHTSRRILHAGGDSTGKTMVNFFIDIVRVNPNITIFENTFVFELICKDKVCYGAKVFDLITSKSFNILAKATFLATGGAASVFYRTTNPNSSTGDGIALAYNTGANITDMEFIQFHPSALCKKGVEARLISEAVRGEGAYLLNCDNERFMLNIHKMAELAPRDIVVASIHREIKNSGKPNVFLSLRHLDAKMIKSRFSSISSMLIQYGYDLTRDLIPVSPAAHYTIGGIKTDIFGRTNIERLYALGETSANGVHGANRLASNSLLECLVFGKRTIIDAVNLTGNCGDIRKNGFEATELYIDEDKKNIFFEEKSRLEKIMLDFVGVGRNEGSLNTAKNYLEVVEKSFLFDNNEYYSIMFSQLITVIRLIIFAAIERKETRGVHIRSDFPETDEKLKGHFVFSKFNELKFVKT